MPGIADSLVVRAALLVAALIATTGAGPIPSDSARPRGTFTDHVIVVSIDGLRPDAIERFGLDALQRLMREGSYSLQASTILPSKTLPSHTSMLTGRTPAGHGIDFNHDNDHFGVVEVPTIFEVARARGFHTAAFFSKSKFRHLDRPESYDYRQAPSSGLDKWMATRTVPDALRYMHHRRPNLLFVHIGEPDYAGHTAGWMSFFYGMAVKRADAAVASIVAAAEREYGEDGFTILVTADHGGHDRDHGSDDPQDTTIPWIAYGAGVRTGEAPAGIRTMDTAATALWLLGLALPAEAEGRPVTGAFDARAVVAGAQDPAPAPAPVSGSARSVAGRSQERP